MDNAPLAKKLKSEDSENGKGAVAEAVADIDTVKVDAGTPQLQENTEKSSSEVFNGGTKHDEGSLAAIFKDWDKIKNDPEWHRRELAELLKLNAEKGQKGEAAASSASASSTGDEASGQQISSTVPIAVEKEAAETQKVTPAIDV